MGIAIVMPIGPLHKWGYQWTCQECIASQAEFADHIYMVQSTQDATGVQEILDKFPNVSLISGPETWHHRPGETDEVLTTAGRIVRVAYQNRRIAQMAAWKDGHDIVLGTHNNWYLPRPNIKALRAYCEDFRRRREILGRAWIVAQLCDKFMGVVYSGLLLNFGGMNQKQVSHQIPNMKLRRPGSYYPIPQNIRSIYFVDCNYEMTVKEYAANRVRYPDYELHGVWNHKERLAARVQRFRKFGWTKPLDWPLDHWGQLIAAKARPDFYSWQILEAMGLKEKDGTE